MITTLFVLLGCAFLAYPAVRFVTSGGKIHMPGFAAMGIAPFAVAVAHIILGNSIGFIVALCVAVAAPILTWWLAGRVPKKAITQISAGSNVTASLATIVFAGIMGMGTVAATDTFAVSDAYDNKVQATVLETLDDDAVHAPIVADKCEYIAYDAPKGSNNFGPTQSGKPTLQALLDRISYKMAHDCLFAATWALVERDTINVDRAEVEALADTYRMDKQAWQGGVNRWYERNSKYLFVDMGDINYFSFGMIPGKNRDVRPQLTQFSEQLNMGYALLISRDGEENSPYAAARWDCDIQPASPKPYQKVPTPQGNVPVVPPKSQPSSSEISKTSVTTSRTTTSKTTSTQPSTSTSTPSSKDPSPDPCRTGNSPTCQSPTVTAESTPSDPAASTEEMPESEATTAQPPSVTTTSRAAPPSNEGADPTVAETGDPSGSDCAVCGGTSSDGDTPTVEPTSTTEASEPAVPTSSVSAVPTAFHKEINNPLVVWVSALIGAAVIVVMGVGTFGRRNN